MTAHDATETIPVELRDELGKPDESSTSYTGVAAPAAAWTFAFLVLRIFAVSGYDWSTAFAVSTTLGVDDGLTLLFGSLMAGHLELSILIVFVLPLLVAAYLWSPGGRRAVVLLLAGLGLITMVALTLSFNRWWLPLATFSMFGALAWIQRLPLDRRLNQLSVAVIARVGWVGGLAMLLVAVMTQTPWVPHERIETTNGTVGGYVLSVDSGYLNVLTDDQEFVIVISGDVISRR